MTDKEPVSSRVIPEKCFRRINFQWCLTVRYESGIYLGWGWDVI